MISSESPDEVVHTMDLTQAEVLFLANCITLPLTLNSVSAEQAAEVAAAVLSLKQKILPVAEALLKRNTEASP